MSLDVSVIERNAEGVILYEWSGNYTHNCIDMAKEAGIYENVWCPAKIGVESAFQIMLPLSLAIYSMESDPERFKKFNPSNGCGDYSTFLQFLRDY